MGRPLMQVEPTVGAMIRVDSPYEGRTWWWTIEEAAQRIHDITYSLRTTPVWAREERLLYADFRGKLIAAIKLLREVY